MINIAAIGCLIAASIFVSRALGQTNQQSPTSINAQSQQQQHAATPGPATEKENLTPEEYQNPCDPTEKVYVADLCEQRRMAEAAIQQVNWIQRQFWATVIEIVLLIGVIGVSGWAAWEAGGSAKAAEASVKIASDTAKRQLRAYLSVSGATVTWKNDRIVLAEISIKNTGQTPALWVHHFQTIAVGEPADFAIPYVESGFPTTDIGANIEMHFSLDSGPVSEESWTLARNREIPVYVWGEVKYWDVFKTELWFTRYRLRLHQSADILSPCSEGNRSS